MAGGHAATSEGMATPEDFAAALPQVASQSDMQAHCTGKGGLCVLALLDSSRPTHEEEHRAVVSLALQQKEGGTFTFAWLEARKHASVLQVWTGSSGPLWRFTDLSDVVDSESTFTITGATFKNCDQRALIIKPASKSDTPYTVAFVGCTFINNYYENSTFTTAVGGAVYIAGAVDVLFTRCTFAGNGAGSGSAVYSEAGASGAGSLRIEGCTFAGNAGQGAVYVEGGVLVNITNTRLASYVPCASQAEEEARKKAESSKKSKKKKSKKAKKAKKEEL
ncbi:hypothetical protein TSOC_012390 [Tetrabaena socialis]|uniref:Right handed beta helix domain-containing protein n=1 Tax=Tetrabaena socialis TaxID=47790 RepID=A0A2J7ZN54_9CHLO|nr:hypothetical protein TSOC_012390 [Tetrabaena socialis]|eukprot:PNH01703.1 hypothetical protein TSOC_012390 [Tetrabaena socialis]